MRPAVMGFVCELFLLRKSLEILLSGLHCGALVGSENGYAQEGGIREQLFTGVKLHILHSTLPIAYRVRVYKLLEAPNLGCNAVKLTGRGCIAAYIDQLVLNSAFLEESFRRLG